VKLYCITASDFSKKTKLEAEDALSLATGRTVHLCGRGLISITCMHNTDLYVDPQEKYCLALTTFQSRDNFLMFILGIRLLHAIKRLPNSSTNSVMAAGLSSLANRTLAQLRVPRALTTSRSPTALPSDLLIEEESIPGYNSKDFYPVNPGEIFHHRYETIAKVGWGSCSTVWLARDLQRYLYILAYSILISDSFTGGDGSLTVTWCSKSIIVIFPTRSRRNTN